MEQNILSQMKLIFKEADLQRLMGMGCPDDEYDNEALMVYEIVNRYDTLDTITDKIHDVFHSQFTGGTDAFGNVFFVAKKSEDRVKYFDVAGKILALLES